MSWFVRAWEADAVDPRRERLHRLRLGAAARAAPQLAAFLTHERAVNTAAFSPDGRALLTAGDDGQAILWNVAAGKPALDCGTTAPAFKPGSAPTGGGSSPAAGTARSSLGCGHRSADRAGLGNGHAIKTMAFDRRGEIALTVGIEGAVQLWHAGRAKPVGTVPHDGAVQTCAISPDGALILTGGTDGKARLWNTADRRPIGEVMHDTAIAAAVFDPTAARC